MADEHIVDLERLMGDYEPLSHSDLIRSVRSLAFHEPKWLYMDVDDRGPWQGDVIPSGELHFTSRDGSPLRLEGPVMLLSHGCDAVPGQDPVAVMAPVFPLEEFVAGLAERDAASRISTMRNNRYSSLMFLPAVRDTPERYVNFNYAAAVSTLLIHDCFANARVGERTRFSKKGWWLFTAKLAHHYVRQESPSDYPRFI